MNGINPVRTGFEQYDAQTKSIDTQQSMEYIAQTLEERNPGKYKEFLRGLLKMKSILQLLGVNHLAQRHRLLVLTYFALRLLDDIADGDTITPIDPEQRCAIIKDKIQKAHTNTWDDNDLFDCISKEIFEIAKEVDLDEMVKKGFIQIAESILFDAQRVLEGSKTRYFVLKTRKELADNFHQMDIDGTIYSTAALFGLEPDQALKILKPLGEAARLAYILIDLLSDTKQGLINIPKEDIEKFDISHLDLLHLRLCNSLDTIPQTVKNWCQSIIEKIDDTMLMYEENITTQRFKLMYTTNPLVGRAYHKVLQHLILPVGYVKEIDQVKRSYEPIIHNVSRQILYVVR